MPGPTSRAALADRDLVSAAESQRLELHPLQCDVHVVERRSDGERRPREPRRPDSGPLGAHDRQDVLVQGERDERPRDRSPIQGHPALRCAVTAQLELRHPGLGFIEDAYFNRHLL